jgi:hypothetical protein
MNAVGAKLQTSGTRTWIEHGPTLLWLEEEFEMEDSVMMQGGGWA